MAPKQQSFVQLLMFLLVWMSTCAVVSTCYERQADAYLECLHRTQDPDRCEGRFPL